MNTYLGFGIIGNFADHLKQAGEDNYFKNIGEEGAPKGLFPFYIPNNETFLGRYCINNTSILIPNNTDYDIHVQAEPEIGLDCRVIYYNDSVKTLVPEFFLAFNDTSIRNDKNAIKLSEKKNFSNASKGCGTRISIDKFDVGGICDNYSITSFLIYDGNIHQYGSNSKLINYTYFYGKLLNWIVEKLNTQQDYSILENLNNIIKQACFPDRMLIAIGATNYTSLGEKRYLMDGDEVCVVVYDHNKYTNDEIKLLIKQGENCLENTSIVRQKVVFDK